MITFQVGRFLGDVDPVLMQYLYNKTIFLMEQSYDFQAYCPVKKPSASAGIKSIFIVSILKSKTLEFLTWIKNPILLMLAVRFEPMTSQSLSDSVNT